MRKLSWFNFINLFRIFLVGLVLLSIQLFAPQSYAFQSTVGSWTSIGLSNCNTWALAVDPNNANILYVPSCGGLLRSVDGGANWSVINPHVGPYGPVAINPQNSNVLYTTGGGSFGGSSGVFKSTDGGTTWIDTTNNLPGSYNYEVDHLLMDQTNPNILYAGMYGGCNGTWMTKNGGQSWAGVGGGCDIASLAIDPTDHNIIYIGSSYLSKSTDGGTTWTVLFQPNTNIRSIAIDPNNHNNIYISGDFNGIYKSTDGGVNWTQLGTSLPSFQAAMIVDPSSPNTLYAGYNNGVHMSTDGGATWTDINTGLPGNLTIKTLLIPANNSNILYASTTAGIYAYGLKTANQPPIVNAIANATLNEGNTYTANGSFTDSDSTSWTATVNYGDGSGTQPLTLSGMNFSLSHVYNTPGTYTDTVKVTDNQGATGTGTATITVVPTTTVTFDDKAANSPLNGSYAGINWGTNAWDVDGSIPTDSTNSISFHSNSVTSGTFSFSTPSILLSTGIYSNSSQTALITLSCSGNNPVSMQVAPNSTATITTNWTTTCTTVTVTSSNGWNTNLDNLVYSSIQNPGVTPNPTPPPPPGPTGGYTTQGALLDTGDANYMNGSKFTINANRGTATSMSVFVGNVDSGTHNKYQMAIYTDNNGTPGTLVAKTSTGTLTPLSWNTLPISATLNANTTYWLMYNTNASTSTDYLNNMYFDTGTQGIAAYASRSFGSWPTNFPTATLSNTQFSLYVTY